MKDNQIWSTSVGRWCGIPVRIHLLLYLFIALLFGAEWNVGFANANFFVGTAMVTALVLVASIVLHELAHVFAVTSIGGRVDELVLMPWGGNSELVVPERGFIGVIAYAAGPFVNGMLFLFGLTLIVQTEHSSIAQLINPFQPHLFVSSTWQVSLVEIMTWVNFQLMVVNLLPCFPFDGAQIIRAIIRGTNIDSPQYRIETAIKLIGNMVAFAMIGFAFIVRHWEPGAIQPAWLFLLLGGITLLFTARYSLSQQTESLDEEWSDLDDLEFSASLYESSSLYLDRPIDESDNIAYSQWLSEKQEARRQHELLAEREEDERADKILQKLHSNGGDLQCLSPEERLILDRFSERIRRRRQQSV
ncbi:MAG: site-2 protease family protein [Planctomycetota bacterium]